MFFKRKVVSRLNERGKVALKKIFAKCIVKVIKRVILSSRIKHPLPVALSAVMLLVYAATRAHAS